MFTNTIDTATEFEKRFAQELICRTGAITSRRTVEF